MSDRPEPDRRVGVRELRQNLSVHLRRVKAGETLDVTERGRVVARLTPLPAESLSPLEQLIAEGRARPAIAAITELAPPVAVPGLELSEVLRTMRNEDDR